MNTPENKSNSNKAAGERGRRASRPGEISSKGWKDVLIRVKDEQSKDNLSMIAAGVAFYAFFAIFPALAAAVSIFGLVADPQQLQQQIDAMSGVMPQQAYELLQNQLTNFVSKSGGALGFGLILGILLTLWSANKGMKALMTALNIVYDEDESRGFVKLNAVSLLFTFCAIFLGLVAIALVIAVPALVGFLDLPGTIETLVTYLRWPLMGIFLAFALAAVYRFCPDRKSPKWRWVSWGAISATVMWLVISALFSFYVSNFGNFGETYGSMGAVIILLMWFFLTSYIVLLGGELNAEMEHQTRRDSTVGKSRAMGRREAYAANTIGESRS